MFFNINNNTRKFIYYIVCLTELPLQSLAENRKKNKVPF